MYRVGYPLWKLAARIGIPVKVEVSVYRDEASNSYWAKSDDLDGLVVSGATLDEVQREVLSAASSLLELSMNGAPRAPVTADMHVRSMLPCAA
jgi:predicted RNase H-like HicB family nuclease